MSRKSFSGHATPATLTSAITSTATSIPVTTTSGWPNTATGSFVVVIDRGKGTLEEKVLVSSYAGNTLTVATRGYDGTTAQAHSLGASCVHTLDAATMTKHETFVAAVGSITPHASAVGDLATKGSSGKPADASHRHARESFGTGASTTTQVTQTAGNGTSTSVARADHIHGGPKWAAAGTTTTSAVPDTRSTGVSTHPARADHKHGREGWAATGTTTTSAPGDAKATGTSTHPARADHKHGREAKWTTVTSRGASGTATAGEETLATAAITLTLPATPSTGTINRVVAVSGTSAIARGGANTITWGAATQTSIAISAGMSVSLLYSGGVWYVIDVNGALPSAKMHPTAQTFTESGTLVTVGHMTTTWLRSGFTFSATTQALITPIGGEYDIKVLVSFQQASGAPGAGFYNAFVGITGSTTALFGSSYEATNNTFQPFCAGSVSLRLTANTKVSLMAQSSSASAATWITANKVYLSCRWIQP